MTFENVTHIRTDSFLSGPASFERLVIAEGAVLRAPEGKLLTLIAAGTVVPAVPGSYENAVVDITDDIPSPIEDYIERGFRTSVYLDENGVVPERSALRAYTGRFDGRVFSGGGIKCAGHMFNGFIVAGGEYEIDGLGLAYTGYGGNDFCGQGSGIVASGDARVAVSGLRVRNEGVRLDALVVGDRAAVTVANSDIQVNSGPPEEFDRFKAANPGVETPAFQREFCNSRAINVVGSGRVLLIDSRVAASGWGVLSTDATDTPKRLGDVSVRIDATNCDLELTGDTGYGAYAIGACMNSFGRCRVRAASSAFTIANEYAGTRLYNGSEAVSRRYGVIFHNNQGGLFEVRDSAIRAASTLFLIKGCYPDIRLCNAEAASGSGVILQLMDNDDPGRDNRPFYPDAAVPVRDGGHDVSGLNYHTCNIFHFEAPGLCTDARVLVRDSSLRGDFYNATTNACPVGAVYPEGLSHAVGAPDPKAEPVDFSKLPPASNFPVNLCLRFENASVAGVISASRAKHEAACITTATFLKEEGRVKNAPAPAVNNGVIVSLDGASRWTVTGESHLTALELEPGAVIDTDSGRCPGMRIDGAEVPIAAGCYAGAITLYLSNR